MIVYDMSNEEYHAHDSISKTGLDLIARSPAHYRYAPRKEPTRSMTIGSATHAAILEPAVYAAKYLTVSVDDRRSSVWKEAVKARSEEFTLTQGEGDRIGAMAEAVRGNAHMAGVYGAPGKAEVSIITKDPVTGVLVRCRFDWLGADGFAADLKTASDASDDAFGKSVVNYRYFVQEAFYRDVFQWETGERVGGFEFHVVESDAPYCTNVVQLPADVIEYGRQVYRRDLNRYADCLHRGEWPGLPGEPHTLALPGWFVNQIEDEMEVRV